MSESKYASSSASASTNVSASDLPKPQPSSDRRLERAICPNLNLRTDKHELRISTCDEIPTSEDPDYFELNFERDILSYYSEFHSLQGNPQSDVQLCETYAHLQFCTYSDHDDHKEICKGKMGPSFKECETCAVRFCDACWDHNVEHRGHSLNGEGARFGGLRELEEDLAKEVKVGFEREEKLFKLFETSQKGWKKWREEFDRIEKEREILKSRFSDVVLKELLENSKIRDEVKTLKRMREAWSSSGSEGSSGGGPVRKRGKREEPTKKDKGDDDEKEGEESSTKS